MAKPSLRVITKLSCFKERIAQLYGYRAAGNMRAFAAGFAVDATYEIKGDSRLVPLAGPRRGRDDIRRLAEEGARRFETMDAMIVDILVDGDEAAVRWQATLRSRDTGAVAEFEVLDHLTFVNGEIVELVQFVDTASLSLLSGRI